MLWSTSYLTILTFTKKLFCRFQREGIPLATFESQQNIASEARFPPQMPMDQVRHPIHFIDV
jgi:hypothetical protein